MSMHTWIYICSLLHSWVWLQSSGKLAFHIAPGSVCRKHSDRVRRSGTNNDWRSFVFYELQVKASWVEFCRLNCLFVLLCCSQHLFNERVKCLKTNSGFYLLLRLLRPLWASLHNFVGRDEPHSEASSNILQLWERKQAERSLMKFNPLNSRPRPGS